MYRGIFECSILHVVNAAAAWCPKDTGLILRLVMLILVTSCGAWIGILSQAPRKKQLQAFP